MLQIIFLNVSIETFLSIYDIIIMEDYLTYWRVGDWRGVIVFIKCLPPFSINPPSPLFFYPSNPLNCF